MGKKSGFLEIYSMSLPFDETQLGDNIFLREFSQDTDSGEFIWHRDYEDRVVESIEDTDWQIQLDNELPKKIQGKVFIPRGVWHRVIKGTGNLRIRLWKLN